MDYTFNYYSENNKVHMKSFDEYGANGQFLQTFAWTNPNFCVTITSQRYIQCFQLLSVITKKHWVNITMKGMIGYNQESKHTTGFNAGREQLISNDLGSLSYATGDRWVGSSDNSWATRSGFFRINYGYDERYLLEVNGRYDLSSKFPSTTVPYSTFVLCSLETL